MAMFASVMVVHFCIIIPDMYRTRPEDNDAKAKQRAVCFLFTCALTGHDSFSITITRRALDYCRRSLTDRECVSIVWLFERFIWNTWRARRQQFTTRIVLLNKWGVLQAVSDIGSTCVIRASALLLIFLTTTPHGTVLLMIFFFHARSIDLKARNVFIFPSIVSLFLAI